MDLGIYVSSAQILKMNGVLQPERLLHPLHPRDGAEHPRFPLAKAIPLHQRHKASTKLVLRSVPFLCKVAFPLPRSYITGSAASRKAEGREGARLHVPHTALKARRIQLGVLVSNFFKTSCK